MRALLRACCGIALLAGGIWPVLAPFRPVEEFATSAPRLRAEHAQLQCFAEGVLQHTEARATIRFVLPEAESDGGLAGHRLRYVVPGRRIVIEGQADYVASWREPAAAGRVIWNGCGGVLVRR